MQEYRDCLLYYNGFRKASGLVGFIQGCRTFLVYSAVQCHLKDFRGLGHDIL